MEGVEGKQMMPFQGIAFLIISLGFLIIAISEKMTNEPILFAIDIGIAIMCAGISSCLFYLQEIHKTLK